MDAALNDLSWAILGVTGVMTIVLLIVVVGGSGGGGRS